MEASIEMIQTERAPRWRVVAGSKVVEASDVDDAFMQADLAFLEGAVRVVIEVIKGERGKD
jgi:hypothetical protein